MEKRGLRAHGKAYNREQLKKLCLATHDENMINVQPIISIAEIRNKDSKEEKEDLSQVTTEIIDFVRNNRDVYEKILLHQVGLFRS
jgi:hypothetical protein